MKRFFFAIFLVLTMTGFSQTDLDFKGFWTGRLVLNDGNEKLIHKIEVSFDDYSKDIFNDTKIKGTVTLFDSKDSTKKLGTTAVIWTYEKTLKVVYYFGIANMTGSSCKGNFIYKIKPSNSPELEGEFKPVKKNCIKGELALHRQLKTSSPDIATATNTTINSTGDNNKNSNLYNGSNPQLEGATQLFANVKNSLSQAEKDQIFSSLRFRLAKDKIQFIDENDKAGEYPFPARVEAIDLNSDGIDEVIVGWENPFGYGTSRNFVALFMKTGTKYQENLVSHGSIEIISVFHNGYPDLVVAGSGMQTPLWEYNGYKYSHNRSVTSEEYEKLKIIRYSDLEKDPTVLKKAKANSIKSGPKISKSNGNTSLNELHQTPPTAVSKKFIYNRWITVDVFGSGREEFLKKKQQGESAELEFMKDGKCYGYRNGDIEGVFTFVLAPDGKSLLLSPPNSSKTATMQIISLTQTKLIVKSFEIFEDDTVVFKSK